MTYKEAQREVQRMTEYREKRYGKPQTTQEAGRADKPTYYQSK